MLALVAAVSALVLAALLGLLAYQITLSRSEKKKFPPPGRLISIGDRQLHLQEQGSGSPTVILESGLAASSLNWAHLQPLLGASTRVVSYDRAGLGWSDPCPASRTLPAMVSDLATLLSAAAIPPPYILVGHSFGGLLIRAFAHRSPGQVAGLLFLDPVSIESWARCSAQDLTRIATGVRLSRRGAWLARLGIVRLALAAASFRTPHITQSIARASAGKAMPLLRRLIGEIQKIPAEVLPAIRWHWTQPKSFLAMAAHLESLPSCARQAVSMPVPAGVPFLILSAATATQQELAERDRWVEDSQGLGQHKVVEGTGHWLHLERPDAVLAAIEDLATAARALRQRVYH